MSLSTCGFECSQPEPGLSNRFLNHLLAAHPSSGHIDAPTSAENTSDRPRALLYQDDGSIVSEEDYNAE